MRRLMLLTVAIVLLGGCAGLTAAPTMSELERCGRWGGSWDGNTCRHGSGP